MGKFPVTYIIQDWTRKTENLNRPVTSNEIELVIKQLPTNKTPGPDGFLGEFTRY